MLIHIPSVVRGGATYGITMILLLKLSHVVTPDPEIVKRRTEIGKSFDILRSDIRRSPAAVCHLQSDSGQRVQIERANRRSNSI